MNDVISLIGFICFFGLIGLTYLYLGLQKKLKKGQLEVEHLKSTYAPIISVDEAINQRRGQLIQLDQDILASQFHFDELRKSLSADYASKRAIYEALLSETTILESKLEDISYGLYTPVYNYTTSDEYKAKLESIRHSLKALIKDDQAIYCPVEWTVSGSRTEGKKMTKQYAKLMLRAFNGECDSAIARVSWNNIGNIQMRITKAYEAINKLGSVNQITITQPYFDLKIAELRLEYELQEKLHAEREEQRMIREQMREEERAQREIELAQKKAEDEEAKYQKALTRTIEEAKRATGDQLLTLEEKIRELEDLLTAAQLQKERAVSMAQQTKAGHVYIISNIGSFGDDVFKIGMTRRLEPMDRVRELGDASVPFNFDVHAMVYSENAPDLEYRIHKQLAEKRINLINNRREFFKVDLVDVEGIFSEIGHPLTLTKLAEAKEYRETLAIREAQKSTAYSNDTPELSAFPMTLN